MNLYCEKDLPDGYQSVYEIDAKNNKVGLIMNVAACIVTVAIVVLSYCILKPIDLFHEFQLLRNIILIFSIVVYMILHEVVHGIVYKLFTKEKLTFGLSFTCAYCGVPNVYVYRTAAMVALLAPFVVFTLFFAAATFIFPNVIDQYYCTVLLGIHLGGCVGDLYVTWLYLSKFKDPSTLMRDTGPKQTFYTK